MNPPCISVKLFNIDSDVSLKALRRELAVSLHKVHLGVTKCVYDGIFSLVSINAVIVCDIKVSDEAFTEALRSAYNHTEEEFDPGKKNTSNHPKSYSDTTPISSAGEHRGWVGGGGSLPRPQSPIPEHPDICVYCHPLPSNVSLNTTLCYHGAEDLIRWSVPASRAVPLQSCHEMYSMMPAPTATAEN